MPSPLLQALKRAVTATTGWTAPQEAWGALQLAKAGVQGNVKNMRLGPHGEVMYDDAGLDTPAAATGSFVATNPASGNDPDVLKHELRHVGQSDTLGPLYVPEALREAVVSNYGSGGLERDAIQHATPQSEILRKGSSMYQDDANPGLMAMLKKVLGQ